MIAYLKGVVQHVFEGKLILNVNSVGYLVIVPAHSFLVGDNIELLIYTAVREDDISLYGFENMRDIEVFEALISVPGIGPKASSNLVTQKGGDNIILNIKEKNANGLKVKGIGQKTSEKIIFNLHSKFKSFHVEGESKKIQKTKADLHSDIIEGLAGLGYSTKEVEAVLEEMDLTKKGLKVEDVIKRALTFLKK